MYLLKRGINEKIKTIDELKVRNADTIMLQLTVSHIKKSESFNDIDDFKTDNDINEVTELKIWQNGCLMDCILL